MAKSKQRTDGLKAELARQASAGLQITQQIDSVWEELQKQPGSEILYRTHLDLMQKKRMIDLEIAKLLRWINPKKGRPNKPINPRQQAAIDERIRGGDQKPSYQQLAIKHSGSRSPKEVKRFADRLKKAMKKSDVSRPKIGK